MDNPKLYEEWKANAKYSEQTLKKKAEEEKFHASADAFFADAPKLCKEEPKKPSLSETYQKQFKMEVKTPEISNPYCDPKAEKMTTFTYNNMLVEQSLKKMAETTGAPPKLTTASGENMNVILRQGADCWRRGTYTQPEYRENLLKSTNRATHA